MLFLVGIHWHDYDEGVRGFDVKSLDGIFLFLQKRRFLIYREPRTNVVEKNK